MRPPTLWGGEHRRARPPQPPLGKGGRLLAGGRSQTARRGQPLAGGRALLSGENFLCAYPPVAPPS